MFYYSISIYDLSKDTQNSINYSLKNYENYVEIETTYLLFLHYCLKLNNSDFSYNCYWEHDDNKKYNYAKKSKLPSDFENVIKKSLRWEIGAHIKLKNLKIGFGWDMWIYIKSKNPILENELIFNNQKLFIYTTNKQFWQENYEK